MSRAELLNNDEIVNVGNKYYEANINFEPYLDAAISKFGLSSGETMLVKLIVGWLDGQLKKAIRKPATTWFGRAVRFLFG